MAKIIDFLFLHRLNGLPEFLRPGQKILGHISGPIQLTELQLAAQLTADPDIKGHHVDLIVFGVHDLHGRVDIKHRLQRRQRKLKANVGPVGDLQVGTVDRIRGAEVRLEDEVLAQLVLIPALESLDFLAVQPHILGMGADNQPNAGAAGTARSAGRCRSP